MADWIELKVPDIGGSTNVIVAEIYVKIGDVISVDDNLVMLETDKATMEVPATMAGVVKEIIVKVGSKVSEGDLILKIESEVLPVLTSKHTAPVEVVDVSPVEVTPISVANKEDATIAVTTVLVDEVAFVRAFASPRIRKLARELGANLGHIKGSGANGRITEEDLKAHIKSVMSGKVMNSIPTNGSGLDLLPWPKVDFAKFGEVEVKELSRIKKLSGANLSRNWVMIPHVTQFDNADITELEAFRKQINEEYKQTEVKVSPLSFIIKACVFVLKKFPEFNASIEGNSIVYKKYYHIGFAADTPTGLVVPVLKDADKKGVLELAKESATLAMLAREGKLKSTDMQGGTFTISSLGGIGGTAFTPIVNAPEVAILGVSKSSIKPVWNGTEFIPRLIMPTSLSYDHRVIDGALAAKFSNYLMQFLSDVRRLVL